MTVDTEAFIKGSSLEVLVPEASNADIEELLTHRTETSDNVISSVERKSPLYFDECITAYIILRTPNQDEARLKPFFARLAVNLEIQAYGFLSRPASGQDASRESSPSGNEDTLWSGKIDTSREPVIVIEGREEGHSAEHLLAVWKESLPFGRPRMRLQSPTVVFKPTATIRPSKDENSKRFKDPYLPSGVPAPVNLLESLKGDPAVQGARPRLSAARLSRISPVASDVDVTDRHIKVGAQKAFRALPAISSRVRYSRANGRAGKPSNIASLDIETAPFSGESVELTVVNMELSDGSTEDLGKSLLPILPLKCQPKDNTVFLFRLTPLETPSDSSTQSSARTVLITVHATVLVSSTCQPKIEMRWKTGVDFSTALNPIFGAPGQSMQRQRRPNNLSRTLSYTNLSSMPAPSRESDSTSGGIQKRQRTVSESNFGVSVTFTAPKNVQVGQPFSWDVLILNRSSKPRQLALTLVPRRKRGSTTGHTSIPSSTSAADRPNVDTAAPVIDENSLYVMQRSQRVHLGEVISLSTDVRIGTLSPDSCIDSDLTLLPLAKGYLQLEAVRLTDVLSNESIDIHDLPDIVAKELAIDEQGGSSNNTI